MTGFFTSPSEIMIMWYCFSTEKSPEIAYKKVKEFKNFMQQVEMFKKAEKEKQKLEEKKK